MSLLFNFLFNNDGRSLDVTQEKICESSEMTMDTITNFDFFEALSDVQFKEDEVRISEIDQFAKVTAVRSSTSNKRAVGFVTTQIQGHKNCTAASVEDFVPLDNVVVFDPSETEVEVLVRVKKDQQHEGDECFKIAFKDISRNVIKEAVVRIQDFFVMTCNGNSGWCGWQVCSDQ